MNGLLELRIITQPYSEVYWGYFRRLVFGNSLTKHNTLTSFGQILCISPNGLQAGHCDAPPPPIPFWMTENEFRSHLSPFQINTQLFISFSTKWLPAAILDDRKSLSIAFLAISDQ